MNKEEAQEVFRQGRQALKEAWNEGQFDEEYRLRSDAERPQFEDTVRSETFIELNEDGTFTASTEITSGCGCCSDSRISIDFRYREKQQEMTTDEILDTAHSNLSRVRGDILFGEIPEREIPPLADCEITKANSFIDLTMHCIIQAKYQCKEDLAKKQ